MLKFKQIRKSIINHKEGPPCTKSPTKSPLRRNLFGETHPTDPEMSFKSIKQNTMSPLKIIDTNVSQASTNKKNKFCFEDSADRKNLSPLSNKKKFSELQRSKGMYVFDSEKKALNYQGVTSNFGSDQKPNEVSSIYINRQNKENVQIQGTTLNFTQRERKLNTTRQNFVAPQIPSTNPLYETTKNPTPGSLTKKNSCSMLFKTALQTSNKKKTFRDSDRSAGRQNSIGKLKEKLFGMKKIISQKENRPMNQFNQGEQTKSFTIYTIKNSTDQKKPDKSPIFTGIKQQIIDKNDEHASFSNLVVGSIQKNLFKSNFGNFLQVNNTQVDNPQMSKVLNESRFDSVNISVAQSCDSILDMSPNL